MPRALILLAAALAAGCLGGSGEGLDANGRPIDGGGEPLAPTLASIQANVFDAHCIQCHAGAAAPVGLRLTEGNSFAALVGAPSGQFPGALRVKAFDPDASYLIRKLEGRDIVGDRMPQSLPPLDQATIDVIRAWIAAGAREEEADAGFRVAALAPEPDAVLAEPPMEVRATFSARVDPATVGQATFLLVGSGGDGGFEEGNEVAVLPDSVTVGAPNEAVMDLAGAALPADLYEARLFGSGPGAVLRDEAGRALDGEFTGAFPSGDGEAGGDFLATFTVRPLLQVVAMSPAPGVTVGTPPASVAVTFNRAPDAATVTDESFALVASGGDGTFDDGNETAVPGAISVDGAEATLDVAGAFLLPDTYQVRLASGGVADEDGSPLDGEFAADLPSGDGAPGGDFVATFQFGVLPTLSSIQANVFDLHCIQCHLGPAAPRGLQLSAGDSYAELVGVASREAPALLLVDPGDPDASYLVRKVEGGPDIVGGQMPLFGDPLDAGTLAAIRQWIADGAENN